MPKHRINITLAAEQDLAEIYDYIANDNPSAALQLIGEIERRILQLEDFPDMGLMPKIRRLARKGYRILIVDTYLVFYAVPKNETVEIRRILSGKRDFEFII